MHMGVTSRGATRAARAAEFREEHQELVAWMETNQDWCSFARSLLDSLTQWGSLTTKQLAAIERTRAKAEAPKAPGPEVDVTGIEKLFETVAARGRKRLKLWLGDYVISRAPETGKNPGALYVKSAEGDYLGKIHHGRVQARDSEEIARTVSGVRSLRDLQMIGRLTGRCCACGLPLSDPNSVADGIGPVCKKRWAEG